MPYRLFGFGLDWTYLLVLAGAVLCMLASAKVQSTFSKYAKVYSRTGMSGAEAARRLLDSQGIYGVSIERVSGNLTDHYDPRSKVLRLSETVYGSTSVAAIGVAAHECGHAMQDAFGYLPLRLRSAFVPIANFGSRFWIVPILIGMFFGGSTGSFMLQLGIWVFALAVLFQLITLPVEFNASGRALRLLNEQGILYREEVRQTRNVLSAAALTYVASAASALLQLLRLIILFGGRRNND